MLLARIYCRCKRMIRKSRLVKKMTRYSSDSKKAVARATRAKVVNVEPEVDVKPKSGEFAEVMPDTAEASERGQALAWLLAADLEVAAVAMLKVAVHVCLCEVREAARKAARAHGIGSLA